jgi:hypothetical protein
MEIMNSQGIALTWTGRSWRPPEAQVGVISDIISGPRIMRPADNFPVSNVPPTSGDLFWDQIGLQLYVWHDDGMTAQWVVTGNTGGAGNIAVTHDATLTGDGSALPLGVILVAGPVY